MASASLVVHRGIEDMRRATLALLLALAFGAGAMTPALAGGLPTPDYRTGINPYGVATPVPAPIPVPVYEASWYLRGDFAAGFGADPSVTATGTPYGGNTLGLNAFTLTKSFEPSFTGGVGVGYVWGPAFRTDLTVDIHSLMLAKFNGTATYNGGASTVTVQDKNRWMSTILLANAYYDFRTGTPFTPYLGGGVGFAVNQLTRESNSTGTAGATSFSGRSTQVQFAAAAMAGLTYEMSSFVALDVNYRFLYVGGPDVDLTINNGATGMAIGALNEHQIRAGLRFSIF
jgi:opacity protein-like surface antigen